MIIHFYKFLLLFCFSILLSKDIFCNNAGTNVRNEQTKNINKEQSIVHFGTQTSLNTKNGQENRDNFYELKEYLKKIGISLHADGVFEIGSRFNTKENDKKLNDKKNNISKNHDVLALYHQIGFALTIAPKLKDVRFGVHIPFLVTGKRAGGGLFNQSYIFLESKFGILKLGSPSDAAADLRIDGVSGVAVGGLGSSEKYEYSMDGVDFITDADTFLSSKFKASLNNSNTSESSRKITYSSPEVNIIDNKINLQFAVSYLPDSSNTGAGKVSDDTVNQKFIYFDQTHKVIDQDSGMDVYKNVAEKALKGSLIKDFVYPKEILSISHIVKNALSVGAKFNLSINEMASITFGGTFEYGESVGGAILYTQEQVQNIDKVQYKKSKTYNLNNLIAGGFGAELSVGDFIIGGGIHSWGKSFFNQHIYPNVKSNKIQAYALTGALGYSVGPFKFSLAAIRSNRFDNIYNKFVLGSRCKLLKLADMSLNLAYTNALGVPTYTSIISGKGKETLSTWGWNLGLKINV